MEKLMEILKNAKPDVDFGSEKALIDNNILDSFDIISIVTEINDTFNVDINVADLVPENFNSAEAIWNLIRGGKQREKNPIYNDGDGPGTYYRDFHRGNSLRS